MTYVFLIFSFVVFTSPSVSASPRCSETFNPISTLKEEIKQQLDYSYFVYGIRGNMSKQDMETVRLQYQQAEKSILEMAEKYIASIHHFLDHNKPMVVPRWLVLLHNQVSRRVEVLSYTQKLIPITYRNPQWPMQTKATQEARRELFYMRKDLEDRLPKAAE